MAGDPNIYDALDRAIARERRALPSSGDVEDSSTWPEEDQQLLVELHEHHAAVDAHRWRAVQVVGADAPTRCQTCGEARPCSTIRDLAKHYDVHGDGEQSGAPEKELSRSDMEGDKVGPCACGLHGRQAHARVSRPGDEPEIYVRTTFSCPPTRPGPHYRLN